MKKIFEKRLLLIMLIICAVAIVFSIFLCTRRDTVDKKQNYVTRAEWISLLGANFDLSTFGQEEPYYKDVPDHHSSFTYVQACREGAILRASKSFKPDKPATREFVAETAVLAVLVDYDASFREKGTSELLRYAIQNSIVSSGKADDKMTVSECEAVIESSKKYYFSLEKPEYANISVKDTVADFRSSTEIDVKDNVVYVPDDIGTEIEKGSIIIIPGYPYGTAVKAKSVRTSNGQKVIETVTPELEEVFEDLEFSFTASPKIEDIIPLQEGITISAFERTNPSPLSNLSSRYSSGSQNTYDCGLDAGYCPLNYNTVSPLGSKNKEDGLSFSVDFNLTEGKLTTKAGFLDATVQSDALYKELFGKTIPEDAGELFEKTCTILRRDAQGKTYPDNGLEEYTGGYEIVGKLSVNNLYVEVQCANNLSSFSCELHLEVDCSLAFKGKFEGSIPIYETVILGPYGVWVKLVFSVYFDVNGQIALGAEIDHTTNLHYINKQFTKIQYTDFDPHIDISGEASGGVKGEVIPTILGIELLDVSAKVGLDVDVDPELHIDGKDTMLCVACEASYPIVSISVGVNDKTIANKLGIEATFELVGESGALAKSKTKTLCHYEFTANGTRNVDACTWNAKCDADKQEQAHPSELVGQWCYYLPGKREDYFWIIQIEQDGDLHCGWGYPFSDPGDTFSGTWSAEPGENGTYIMTAKGTMSDVGDTTIVLRVGVDGDFLAFEIIDGEGDSVLFENRWYERVLDFDEWLYQNWKRYNN